MHVRARWVRSFFILVAMLVAAGLLAQPAAGATAGSVVVAAASAEYSDVTDRIEGNNEKRPASIPSVPGTTHVVVPGTGDASGSDQLGRMAGWFANGEHVMLVNYPATIGPIIGGISAPGYDDSRDQGVLNTLVAVCGIDGHVTIYGYSQGAEAAGNAAELIHLLGLKDDDDVSVVLLADPRFPNTGLKEQLKNQHPVVSFVLKAFFGVETNGERDPADTGDIKVTSVAVIGDPVTALETWYLNPVGFVFNTVTGFFMIHSGIGAQSASNKDELPVLISWTEGSAEYVVLDAAHPVVQTLEYIGIPVSARGGRFVEFISPRTVPGQEAARVPGIFKTISFIKNEVAIARQEHQEESVTTLSGNSQVPESQSAAPAVVGQAPVTEVPSSVSNDSNEEAPVELNVPSDNPVAKEEDPSVDTEVEEGPVETQEPKSDSVQPASIDETSLVTAA